MDVESLIAELTGITGMDANATRQVVALAQQDPAQAAGLLQAYEAAQADGTRGFIERAWAVIQVGLNIAVPLAGALETFAGLPGAAKSL